MRIRLFGYNFEFYNVRRHAPVISGLDHLAWPDRDCRPFAYCDLLSAIKMITDRMRNAEFNAAVDGTSVEFAATEKLSEFVKDNRLRIITSLFNEGAVTIDVRDPYEPRFLGDEDRVLTDVPVAAMADGTYTDAAFGGSFTVSGGKLSGTVKAGKVAVVYRSRLDAADRVSFKAAVELDQATQDFLTDSIRTTILVRNCTSAVYQIDGGAQISCVNGTVLTFGADMEKDRAVTVKVTGLDAGGAVVAETEATYTKRVAHGQTVAYFDGRAYPDWDDIFVYVYSNDGNNGGWPGVRPEKLDNGLYRYVLPYALESASGIHVMWTNNGTKTEGKQELPMEPRTSMIYKADRTWVAYDGTLAGLSLSQPGGSEGILPIPQALELLKKFPRR